MILGLLIGIEELVVGGLVALVIFGGSLLPDLGKKLGQAVRGLKQSTQGMLDDELDTQSLEDESDSDEEKEEPSSRTETEPENTDG